MSNMKYKSLYIILLNLALVLATVSLISLLGKKNLAMPDGLARTTNRFLDLSENLELITKSPDKTNFFIGSSVWEFFLDTNQFDHVLSKKGLSESSYNLSFRGMIGASQYALVSNLKNSDALRNKKINSVIFEFAPASMAAPFINLRKRMIEVMYTGIFLNDQVEKDFVTTDLPFWISYKLMQAFDLQEFNVIWRHKLTLRATGNKENIKKALSLENFWRSEVFSEKQAWNLSAKGLNNWNLPESRVEFDKVDEMMHAPDKWHEMIRGYKAGMGIGGEGFRLDQTTFDMFVRSINLSKKFSNKQYIVLLPMAPDYQKAADRTINYEEMFKRIYLQTGIKVIDMRKMLPLTNEDFMDALHMKRDKLNQFLELLANQYANIERTNEPHL